MEILILEIFSAFEILNLTILTHFTDGKTPAVAEVRPIANLVLRNSKFHSAFAAYRRLLSSPLRPNSKRCFP